MSTEDLTALLREIVGLPRISGRFARARRSDMLDIRIGERFGRLVVLALDPAKSSHAMWRCRCDCGEETITASSTLRSGGVRSCGCLRVPHGHCRGGRPSPTYASWMAMRGRCTRKGRREFRRYGGRGITVCERWRSFNNFLADMGERPEGTTLDRIDKDGNYEPGNVRWATARDQSNNRSTNRLLIVGGEALTIAQWARRVGTGQTTIRERLQHGWPPERAVLTPVPKE